MNQSNTDKEEVRPTMKIGKEITAEKYVWGATLRDADKHDMIYLTHYEAAKVLIFSAGGIGEALKVLAYEYEEMEKEKVQGKAPS